ncbi:MAG: hypothetical protein WC107_03030 [Patescibacteria group bacterium]
MSETVVEGESDDEEEDDYWPKTKDEAIESFMCLDFTDRDFEIIEECAKKNIDKILPDFEESIRLACGFDSGNKKLLEVCGDANMDPHDASRVIMLAIWDYFHFTQ